MHIPVVRGVNAKHEVKVFSGGLGLPVKDIFFLSVNVFKVTLQKMNQRRALSPLPKPTNFPKTQSAQVSFSHWLNFKICMCVCVVFRS